MKLCHKHNLQLCTMLKNEKMKEENKEEKREEKEKKEQEQDEELKEKEPEEPEEPEEELSLSQRSQPLSNSKAGRKQKYLPLQRLKIALTALRGSSFNHAGEINSINEADSYESLLNLKCASRYTAIQTLCELYLCYKFNLDKVLSEALDIALVLDSTTDKDREVLGVYFAGRNEKENIWSLPFGVVETRGQFRRP